MVVKIIMVISDHSAYSL